MNKKIIEIMPPPLLAYTPASTQKCFPFNYNGYMGLADITGNELVEPLFDKLIFLEAKKIWVMVPKGNANTASVTFNEVTRQQKKYKVFQCGMVTIAGENFSLVDDFHSHYLLSEQTDRKEILSEDYEYIFNISKNFILGSYTPAIKTASGRKRYKQVINYAYPYVSNVTPFLYSAPVNFAPINGEIDGQNLEGFTLMCNNTELSVMIKGEYLSVNKLYTAYNTYTPLSTLIEPLGFVFSDKNNHNIYNYLGKRLAIIKRQPKIKNSGMSEYDLCNKMSASLLQKCSILLNTEVTFDRVPLQEVPKYYEDEVKTAATIALAGIEGGTELVIKDALGIITKVFYTKNTVDVDARNLLIQVATSDLSESGGIDVKKDTESIDFNIDMDTKKVVLPKKYLALFNIIIY